MRTIVFWFSVAVFLGISFMCYNYIEHRTERQARVENEQLSEKVEALESAVKEIWTYTPQDKRVECFSSLQTKFKDIDSNYFGTLISDPNAVVSEKGE